MRFLKNNNLISKYKQGFDEYKKDVNCRINSEVYNEITSIENRVKARANVYKMTDIQNTEDKLKRLIDAEKQKGIHIPRPKEPEIKLNSSNVDYEPKSNNISEIRDRDEHDKSDTDYGEVEPYIPSAREELLQLHRALRNQKNFMKMKEIIMKEKHEREIFNLKQQLTSNQCLWEQLSESEKREQIMRQELFFTQQSLATCEKIISKMQNQLETLQNQRLRLQQYKNNKSKRLEELESKVRQMEILENIDLNKLLDELRLRDKKLSQLTGVEKNLKLKVDAVYKLGERKVEEMRTKYLKEKKYKESAFSRLEGLRMEIRAIEGQDIGDDIWKEKCKELFSLCKELQKENEELRSISQVPELHNIATPEMGSMGDNAESLPSYAHFQHQAYEGKPNAVDRIGAKTLTTKPSTSAQQNRFSDKSKNGYMSGGLLAGALRINEIETSPGGSAKSSGLKKIYSKQTHYVPEYKNQMPMINQTQYNRKEAQSQGNQNQK